MLTQIEVASPGQICNRSLDHSERKKRRIATFGFLICWVLETMASRGTWVQGAQQGGRHRNLPGKQVIVSLSLPAIQNREQEKVLKLPQPLNSSFFLFWKTPPFTTRNNRTGKNTHAGTVFKSFFFCFLLFSLALGPELPARLRSCPTLFNSRNLWWLLLG